nr:MAG TPA: hypothetical protein [Inoviridae sp.]
MNLSYLVTIFYCSLGFMLNSSCGFVLIGVIMAKNSY